MSPLPIHKMQLPREITIGSNTLAIVGDICSRLGYSGNALVISGPHTMEIAGQAVADSLSGAGFDASTIVVDSATPETVTTARKKIESVQPSIVLGVGGGRVIDITKLSSTRGTLPFISIPTTASHDGIASPRASIKGGKKPHSIKAESPIAIIADTDIIAKAPYRLLASGCGDLIANSTAVKDWELSYKLRNEYYGEYSASLSRMCAELVIRNASLIKQKVNESIRIVLEGLISSGVAMGIAGSSRPASGSEHMFSHSLDLLTKNHAMHGEQCGVGAIMMMHLHGGDWQKIRGALKEIGSPTTAEELGVSPENIIDALCNSHKIRPERYTILGVKGLTREAAERLAKITGVIN